MSTRQLTDSGANVTDAYTFDAFGVLLTQTGSFTVNSYLYASEQFDPSLGFYNLRARYMNQTAGRFVSPDPFFGVDQDPLTVHKYLYASGNPIHFRDPSGLF